MGVCFLNAYVLENTIKGDLLHNEIYSDKNKYCHHRDHADRYRGIYGDGYFQNK